MNLQLSEEHLAVRDAARDFAQNVLKPGVVVTLYSINSQLIAAGYNNVRP